jgi:mannitol/fructose-specific phosphotransferase system IIA component
MKDVTFLDSVLTMRYQNSTTLGNVILIPLNLYLYLTQVKDCFIYGIVVPSLMSITTK